MCLSRPAAKQKELTCAAAVPPCCAGAVRAADLAPALDFCQHDALQGELLGAWASAPHADLTTIDRFCSHRAASHLACTGVTRPARAACAQLGATIRQGGRPEVPAREALPGPDTVAWAGLDAYVQLMR